MVALTVVLKTFTTVSVAFDKRYLYRRYLSLCAPWRESAKEIIRTPKGELVYDFGLKLAGVVELKMPGDFDGTFVLQHAEILAIGNFYTDNLRSAKAMNTFTCKGAHVLPAEFTFYGFRYMKL